LLKLAGAAVNNLAAQLEKGFPLEKRTANGYVDTAVLEQCVKQQQDTSSRVAELETRLAEVCDGSPGLSEFVSKAKLKDEIAELKEEMAQFVKKDELKDSLSQLSGDIGTLTERVASSSIAAALGGLTEKVVSVVDARLALVYERIRALEAAPAAPAPGVSADAHGEAADPHAVEGFPVHGLRTLVRTSGLKTTVMNNLPGVICDWTSAPERYGVWFPLLRERKSIRNTNLSRYVTDGKDVCPFCDEPFDFFTFPHCECDPDVVDPPTPSAPPSSGAATTPPPSREAFAAPAAARRLGLG